MKKESQKQKPKVLLYTYHEYRSRKIDQYLYNLGYDVDTIYTEVDIDYIDLSKYNFFLIDTEEHPKLISTEKYEKFSVKIDNVLDRIYKHTMTTDKPAFFIHYIVYYDSTGLSKKIKNIKGSKMTDGYYGLVPTNMMYSYTLGGVTDIYGFMSGHFSNTMSYDLDILSPGETIISINVPGEEEILLILNKDG